MAVDNFEAPYALIIKTDQYAGNFEREMCASVTGSYGECGVGEMRAEEFHDEFPERVELSYSTVNEMDDHGCARPVSIYNDGDGYNSVIIFFQDKPSEDEFAFMLERAKEYCASYRRPLNLKGFRLISNQVVRTQTTIQEATI